MPRAAVEIDDKHRRAEGLGSPQQAQPRVAAEIVEDEPALAVLAEFRDHRQTSRSSEPRPRPLPAAHKDVRRANAKGAAPAEGMGSPRVIADK